MNGETARIRNITIYPVKSAAGIGLHYARMTRGGLTYGPYSDHQFMVVSDDAEFVGVNGEKQPGVYNFVTQRDKRNRCDNAQGLSAMALIKPMIEGNNMTLTWEYSDRIGIPPDRDQGTEIPVKIWDHVSYCVDQGDEIAEWLSGNLNLPARLVKASGHFQRTANQSYMTGDNPLFFQDAYPIHWFPIESVAELSWIAGECIPWQSFRPQIVVEGMEPQYEHKVHSGTINGVPFVDPKPCDRCPTTTIDQETGKMRGKEPLMSLASYKRWINNMGGQKVIFGENMNPLGEGKISVGDEMIITSLRDPPLVYGKDV